MLTAPSQSLLQYELDVAQVRGPGIHENPWIIHSMAETPPWNLNSNSNYQTG